MRTGKTHHVTNDTRKQCLKSCAVTKSSILNIRRQLTCAQITIFMASTRILVVFSTYNENWKNAP